MDTVRDYKISLTDIETGEILFDKTYRDIFRESESYAKKHIKLFVDSLCRGVLSGRSLSLDISVFSDPNIKCDNIF